MEITTIKVPQYSIDRFQMSRYNVEQITFIKTLGHFETFYNCLIINLVKLKNFSAK